MYYIYNMTNNSGGNSGGITANNSGDNSGGKNEQYSGGNFGGNFDEDRCLYNL